MPELKRYEIENIIRLLLKKYDAEYVLLFGSYAREEQTSDSDLDVIVYGGEKFKKTNIFSFAEDLREMTGKAVDAFEICEVDKKSEFYDNVIKEGIKIA